MDLLPVGLIVQLQQQERSVLRTFPRHDPQRRPAGLIRHRDQDPHLAAEQPALVDPQRQVVDVERRTDRNPVVAVTIARVLDQSLAVLLAKGFQFVLRVPDGFDPWRDDLPPGSLLPATPPLLAELWP